MKEKYEIKLMVEYDNAKDSMSITCELAKDIPIHRAMIAIGEIFNDFKVAVDAKADAESIQMDSPEYIEWFKNIKRSDLDMQFAEPVKPAAEC